MTIRIADPLPPQPPAPFELLYEFLKRHTRVRCELVDRGKYGIEACILHNEEFLISHTFAEAFDSVHDDTRGLDSLGRGGTEGGRRQPR